MLWQAKKQILLKPSVLANHTPEQILLKPSVLANHTPGAIWREDSQAVAQQRRYAALEKRVQQVAKEGLAVIVPGLGSLERSLTVERNLLWLKRQGVPFDCWIFVYRSEEELPLDESRFRPCSIVRHRGFWLSHVLAMPLHATNKPWVLHMEESSEPQLDVNLTVMFETMITNGLGHAAPTFDTEKTPDPYGCAPPCGCCGSLYPILARQKAYPVGRFVDFIEMHFDVFTREYFACLQDSIAFSTSSNQDESIFIGWGMDKLLPGLCGGAAGGSLVHAGRMGLMDQMTIEKRHHSSYDLDIAGEGQKLLLRQHPQVALPTYRTLGALVPPPRHH
jgi:hypothetical protein